MAAPQVVKVPRPLAESPGLTVREFRHCLSAQRLRANGEQGSKEEGRRALAAAEDDVDRRLGTVEVDDRIAVEVRVDAPDAGAVDHVAARALLRVYPLALGELVFAGPPPAADPERGGAKEQKDEER